MRPYSRPSLALCTMLICALFATPAVPQPALILYNIEPQGSDVAAKVSFFGLSSKTAHFPRMTGQVILFPAQPDRTELTVELDARALTAPDPVTLGRLKGPKFFDVDHFPTIRFTGHRLTLSNDRQGRIDGDITARGVTRPISLDINFAASPMLNSGSPMHFSATGTLDRRDFGMTAYPFIVGRKVSISISARIVPATG